MIFTNVFSTLALAAVVAADPKYALIAFNSDHSDVQLHFVGLIHGDSSTTLGISDDTSTNFVVDTAKGFLQTADGQFVQQQGHQLVLDASTGTTGFGIDEVSAGLTIAGKQSFIACPTGTSGEYTIEVSNGSDDCANAVPVQLKYSTIYGS